MDQYRRTDGDGGDVSHRRLFVQRPAQIRRRAVRRALRHRGAALLRQHVEDALGRDAGADAAAARQQAAENGLGFHPARTERPPRHAIKNGLGGRGNLVDQERHQRQEEKDSFGGHYLADEIHRCAPKAETISGHKYRPEA